MTCRPQFVLSAEIQIIIFNIHNKKKQFIYRSFWQPKTIEFP